MPILIHDCVDMSVQREAHLAAFAPCQAETHTQRRILQESSNRGGQPVRTLRRHKQSRFALNDHLRDAADIRADDWPRVSHRFEHRESERLRVGWCDADIRGDDPLEYVSLKTDKLCANVELNRKLFHAAAVRSVILQVLADKQQVGSAEAIRNELSPGTKQVLNPLSLNHLTGEEHELTIGRQA
jgi:hypothetical protein